jgi:hypothetical protein
LWYELAYYCEQRQSSIDYIVPCITSSEVIRQQAYIHEVHRYHMKMLAILGLLTITSVLVPITQMSLARQFLRSILPIQQMLGLRLLHLSIFHRMVLSLGGAYVSTYFPRGYTSVGEGMIFAENGTYATCDYCHGKYWPDNKSGEHTLLIYSTQQPLSDALDKLGKLVKDNVYI